MGKKIKHLREARGISLRNLAKAVGVYPSHGSRVENGKSFPSWKIIIKLSEELDVCVKDIVVCECKRCSKKYNCDVNISFGENIKQLREINKISQRYLSSYANVHYSYINKIENNKKIPSWELICKISKILCICPKDLIPCICRSIKRQP